MPWRGDFHFSDFSVAIALATHREEKTEHEKRKNGTRKNRMRTEKKIYRERKSGSNEKIKLLILVDDDASTPIFRRSERRKKTNRRTVFRKILTPLAAATHTAHRAHTNWIESPEWRANGGWMDGVALIHALENVGIFDVILISPFFGLWQMREKCSAALVVVRRLNVGRNDTRQTKTN